MNTRIFKYVSLSIALLWGITGCNEDHNLVASGNSKAITVRLAADNSTGTGDESAIHRVTGYRFVDGTLAEVITPSQASAENLYTFVPASFSGTLYIVGNARLLTGLDALTPESSTLDDFLSIEGSIGELTGEGSLGEAASPDGLRSYLFL